MDEDSFRPDRCVPQPRLGSLWFRFSVLTLALGLMILAGVIIAGRGRSIGALPDHDNADASSLKLTQPAIDSVGLRKDAQSAKMRLLFVGNSHTGSHNLPELVMKLLSHRFSSGYAVFRYVPVGSLDDNGDALMQEIESGNWNTVILQAQKISSSGKYHYPTDTGIMIAKKAIKHDCQTFLFSEWGIQNVADHSNFTESIYRSMADESGGQLIPVGRVWEAVLASQPTMALYSADRNHQSRLGASLTALVIACYLTNEPAASFEKFIDPEASTDQWNLFIQKAGQVQSGR